MCTLWIEGIPHGLLAPKGEERPTHSEEKYDHIKERERQISKCSRKLEPKSERNFADFSKTYWEGKD
jgi:hypothetical protein